ncbi:MAG TPA: hypothetical protein VJ731_15220 [Terriglobales bacterium]|nr:hypothetical protein [Terriglobales bacterium]
MFAGHYAASFGAGRLERRIPLWHLFIATQFLDIAWCVFILLGIEKARFAFGLGSTPLDLYYMPYTHSLPGALTLSCLGAIVYAGAVSPSARRSLRTALVIGFAIFSHWIFDLISHRPDLPLYGNEHKLGFSVGNQQGLELTLEAGILLASLLFYVRGSTLRKSRKMGLYAVIATVLLIQVFRTFGPPEPSVHARAAALLAYYILLTAGCWITSSGHEANGGEHRRKSAAAS